ncbi:uncharacterized protein IL334_002808 [Kwoniella shivajii]|uniref:GDP/GTP exchange factor Sec2 N-terminal domain-containing protein n=1 Tax=Kwoniella shivajii TaxID=564305 RepID=A0ABZ1CVS2_9TREE|nr:hypothetical protein IL334_002808 [Kwoniella shivajii]
MTSPNPADHPLPISPDPNISPLATLPLALHPDTTDISPETEALITSLRTSLASAQSTISTQTTRLSTLSDVETALAQLKDQYAFLSAAKEAVETQLQQEKKKREVAEENVEMLRGQVEQARRGVMTLQKQEADRKRMSVMSGSGHQGLSGILGLGLNEEEILSNIVTPGSNTTTTTTNASGSNDTGSGPGSRESKLVKRQSIMRSHRRQSSQSEPSDIHERERSIVSPNPQNSTTTATLRPGAHGLRELRLGSSAPPTAATLPSPNATLNNPNQSGYFDDNSEPPSSVLSKTAELPSKKEIEALEETTKLRSELSTLQVRLEESEEARLASETCLRALREFMAADPNTSEGDLTSSTAELLKGIRLPPLPTDKDADEEQRHAEEVGNEKAKPAGWGFKLWNAKSTNNPTSPNRELPPPSISPSKGLSPIDGRSRAGSTATVSPLPTPAEEIATPTAAFLTSSSTSQTPLSSFVSNWTKGVTSPPATSSSPQTERPPNSRKISVSSFFSRGGAGGGKKETITEPVQEEVEKELPTPPEQEQDLKALEPSPEISMKTLDAEEEKRLSKGTTMTDLEEELGTPQGSLQSVIEEEAKDEVSLKGKESWQM